MGIRAGGGGVTRGGASGRVTGSLLLVKGEERLSDNVVVENLGASELRAHEPRDEEGLANEVEGEVVKNRPESGGFDKVEETEDDPVSQPLLIVVLSRALQSLHAQVSGDGPSDQVGQRRGQAEEVEKDQKDESSGGREDTVDLGDSGLFLGLVQDGVLREVLVQPDSVLVGNSSTLLDVRVAQDLVLGLVGTGLDFGGLMLSGHGGRIGFVIRWSLIRFGRF